MQLTLFAPETHAATIEPLVALSRSVRPDIAVALGQQISPRRTKWYTTCQAYLDSPDMDDRMAATEFLPDIITDRRDASHNANGAGKLLSLYEGILAEQPPVVQAAAAKWAGLLAIRTLITNAGQRGACAVGEQAWPIQPWLYRTNVTRADKICSAFEEHVHEAVRVTTKASLNYWQAQPRTPIRT